MGRHTKLTPEVTEAVCRTLMAGVDIETACRREGISDGSYYGWRRRGIAGEEPYASFLEATDRAMANVEVAVTSYILRDAKQDWKAGAWWLRFRKTQGKQVVELTGKDGAPITVGQLSPDAADEIRQKILYGETAVGAAARDEGDEAFGTGDPEPEGVP
jgi:hypothetical protein